MSEPREVERETWQFEVDGFALDAPQKAKSIVAEEHDVDYRDLRARKVRDGSKLYGRSAVVVVAQVR